MKKLQFLLFFTLFLFSCSKETLSDTKTVSELTSYSSNSLNTDCSEKIKGKLKNDKHRQLVKKYYDKNVKKDARINRLGKPEWNHIVTLDNQRQVMSIVPITKNGPDNKVIVTHVFVLYTNWFGHKYLIFDRNTDRNKIKDKELFDNIFSVADYVFDCNSSRLVTRGECGGILEWLFGNTVQCFSFESSFWKKVGNFFSNIWDAIDSSFQSSGGNTESNEDWANFFYFGYGYTNNNSVYYSSPSNGGNGSTNSGADPTDSYEPSQLIDLQNCVNNSYGLQEKIEQIQNDFYQIPNIQNIVADKLVSLCSTNGYITPAELENAVATDILDFTYTSPLFAAIAAEVIAEYEYLKLQWSQENNNSTPSYYTRVKLFSKAFWNVTNEAAHVALDMCGLIPAFGEVCDLTNGVIYTIEGDYTNASFSYAAMVPFVGWVSTGTKYVAFAVKTAAGKTINLSVKLVGNLVEFGNRSDLRKALGLIKGDIRQAHHLVAWEFRNHPIIQMVARNASKANDFFHMNHQKNGIAIDSWRNQPNHPLYNSRIEAGLNAIQAKFGLSNPAVLKIELEKFEDFLRNKIVSNPNSHLDDIIFTYIP